MHKLGIIGWRGMVGSVLMERMEAEGDFYRVNSYLFSTSQKGEQAAEFPNCHPTILDSNNISHLKDMNIIISCQGGSYTKEMHPALRKAGWSGHWIDAASELRMKDDAIITLDPINKENILNALNNGKKDFVGGNCTVSLMLMGLGGLFKEGLVEWMTSMSYQAASGAGAQNMIELLEQMNFLGTRFHQHKNSHPGTSALEYEKMMTNSFTDPHFPQAKFGAPLALSLMPWIDSEMPNGQTREEWKAQAEANKILNTKQQIPIDGTCVRVGALRCHSQAFTIKLKKFVPVTTIESIIADANEWVELVPNDREATIQKLTPAYATGTLKIPIGRIRKMTLGDTYLNAFSIGDQLLWGAAEPLRRTLRLIID